MKDRNLKLNILNLSRAAEISADRIGFLACNSLEDSLRANFKLASGLSDKHFNFKPSTYLDQLRDLEDLGKSSTELWSTHPSFLIRMQSLIWFSMTKEYHEFFDNKKKGTYSLSEVDEKLDKKIKKVTGDELEVSNKNIYEKALIWGSLDIYLSDKKFSKMEQDEFASRFGEKANKAISLLKMSSAREMLDKKIDISFNVVDSLGSGILGSGWINNSAFIQTPTNSTIQFGTYITNMGSMEFNSTLIQNMKENIFSDGNSEYYYIILHEMGHVLGIGGGWKSDLFSGYTIENIPIVDYTTYENGNIVTKKYYTGENALREYKDYYDSIVDTYANSELIVGIPIENDGGQGTVNVHPEEGYGTVSSNNTYIFGIFHSGLDLELMTAWTDTSIMPLSKITLGLLQDIGYLINNYNLADDYQLPSFHSPNIQELNKTSQSFNYVQMTNPYTFNDVPYGDNNYIGMTTGTYTLTGVTSAHPIGFVINDTTKFEVISGTVHGNKTKVNSYGESISTDYYTSDPSNIVIEVKGDFGKISYD